MDIQQILSEQNISTRITKLKAGRDKELPDIVKLKSQWDVMQHKTLTDRITLPDRIVTIPLVDANGKKTEAKRVQPVNRIALPLQKKIVNTAVSFAFGNPVSLNAEPNGADQQLIFDAMRKIGPDAKEHSYSREMYRELLRATEVAELWYAVEKKENHSLYGFPTKLKVRVALFKPFLGDKLYPYFDERGDMIAFSREFSRYDENRREIIYFECYTDAYKYLWRLDGGSWTEAKPPVAHNIGKIPVCYVTQEAAEWADVQLCIERLEFLLSKFAETNDYHASPTLFTTGDITMMPKRGESGKVIQGGVGADAKYVSWDHAPESIRLEIETKLRFIYSLTQTPDISFDSVKGLSAISGVALEMLFMDAHLKVQEKKEQLDAYLQRRTNIQKRIIGMLSGKESDAESLEVTPEIIPYKINDETTLISNLTAADGGKAIISQKTAIKTLGWAKNTDEELVQIQKEEEQSNSFDMFEPSK